MRGSRLYLALLLFTLVWTRCPAAATPTVLFNNDQPNVPACFVACDGLTVNQGFAVSDQFRLLACSDVTGFRVLFWEFPGSTLNNICYAIRQDASCPCCKSAAGGQAFSGAIVDGCTAHGNVTAIPDCSAACCGFTPFPNVYGYTMQEYQFCLPGFELGPGAYFLQLCNASATCGDPIYWDESHQKSPGGCCCIALSNCAGVAVCNAGKVLPPTSGTFAFENSVGRVGSNSFEILGTGAAAPEIDESSAAAPAAALLAVVLMLADRRKNQGRDTE